MKNNISNRIELNQINLNKSLTNIDSIKDLVISNTEDLKNYSLDVSIEQSSKLIKKLQDMFKI